MYVCKECGSKDIQHNIPYTTDCYCIHCWNTKSSGEDIQKQLRYVKDASTRMERAVKLLKRRDEL